ncbi:MAG TPA: branched-chain amino acid ABC transporter permease [Alphaproteobacteria bacterium]|nr:branched-chain amino acid ABC transporter permease [Alphaproteobacteria bacterium]
MSRTLATVTALGVALAALPWLLGNDFYVNLSSQILIYALFALSINLLSGYAGLTSLGHAAYFGGAAYACAWLINRAGFDQASAAVAAVLFGTALAAVFGVLSLRASGLGFLMITLALGQIVWGIAYRWVELTGGDNGMRLGARPAPLGVDISRPLPFYYFTAVVLGIALYCLWRLARSPFGASLRGTRDQPRRMRMLGHHVWLVQWIAFVMSGFWASIAGVLFVYYNQFVSPITLSLQQSAEVLLMSILGGAGTLAGPIVGAIVITLVKNVVSSYLDRWNTLLGVIFVVSVIFMPDGIVPGSLRLWRRLTGAASPKGAAKTP